MFARNRLPMSVKHCKPSSAKWSTLKIWIWKWIPQWYHIKIAFVLSMKNLMYVILRFTVPELALKR